MLIHPFCCNEYDELKKVIMCSPSKTRIPTQAAADDVQWEKPVNPDKTTAAFQEMTEAMTREGVEVIDYSGHLPEPDQAFHARLINRVFVRDLACAFGTLVVPGEAGISMRRPEYLYAHKLFENWFPEDRFSLQANNETNALEFGDVLVLSKEAVFINTGLRTSFESVLKLLPLLWQEGFSEVGVIDLPRRGDTMHMDMNCNVAAPDLLIAKSYMKYFPVQVFTAKESTYMMMDDFITRHGYDIFWTDEIHHTVADINFLNVNPETLLVSTKAHKKVLHHEKLKKKNIIRVDVDELENGGGGIRCMTLPVERR